MDKLNELYNFLKLNHRLDLKSLALSHVLGITGSDDGCNLILNNGQIIETLIDLTEDKCKSLAKDSTLALINLSATTYGAVKLLKSNEKSFQKPNIIQRSLKNILDEKNELADPWSMILSNITRVETIADEVLAEIEKHENILEKLVNAFSKLDFNKFAKLHYLGLVICNLTQTKRGRELICSSPVNTLQKVIAFSNYKDNIVRREGSIGTIKNICFDLEYHQLILDENTGYVNYLLLPLAGPEELTEEENDKLPIELQYLGDDKERECDSGLRIVLLESILQLCATRAGRESLRSKGVYEILREYHKWESNHGKDRKALLSCEKVVDILIRKENEIGIDNIRSITIPRDLEERFIEEDINFILDT